VVDVDSTERRRIRTRPRAQVVLVQEQRRRAVLRGEFGDGRIGQGQDTVDAAGGQRPDGRVEPVDVRGDRARVRLGLHVGMARPGGMGVAAHAYIRSGAETPNSARPFARTMRVASLSQARVRLTSSIGSSPLGMMRHESYQRWYVPASSSR